MNVIKCAYLILIFSSVNDTCDIKTVKNTDRIVFKNSLYEIYECMITKHRHYLTHHTLM